MCSHTHTNTQPKIQVFIFIELKRETFDVFVFLNPVLIFKLFKYNYWKSIEEKCAHSFVWVSKAIDSFSFCFCIYLFAFFFLLILLPFFFLIPSQPLFFFILLFTFQFFFLSKKESISSMFSHYFTFLWKYIKSSDYHFCTEHQFQPAILSISYSLFLLFGLCGFYPVLMGCYSKPNWTILWTLHCMLLYNVLEWDRLYMYDAPSDLHFPFFFVY